MNFEHVAINVSEPAKLAQWLVDNLGMRIVLSVDEPPYMNFVADEAGSMFELYRNDAVPIPDYSAIDPFNLHFAFASDDIETDKQRLIDAGATSASDITSNALGDKLTFLRSPWNEPLQLIQRVNPLI